MITDGGPFDPAGSGDGVIDVNTAALNTQMAGFGYTFQFSSLSATSNSTLGVPFSQDAATLSQNGSVFRATGAVGNSSITILVTDNNYNFPNPPGFLDSSASDTWTNTSAASNRTFGSYYDQNNTMYGTAQASPGLAFSPPVGLGPFSTAGTALTTALSPQAIPFALTNQTVVTLGAPTAGMPAPRDQFTGATTVFVPEPSSVTLISLGFVGLMGYGWRRRLQTQMNLA